MLSYGLDVDKSSVLCSCWYPLELSCDEDNKQETAVTLNPDAAVFRPRRDAAAAAKLQVKDIVQAELNSTLY